VTQPSVQNVGSQHFTVLGASGFIGSHLVQRFREKAVSHYSPEKWTDDVLKRPLGHVIYCIGLTADWRQRRFDTVKAHVGRLLTILEDAQYDSVLYLSSTRVYKRTPTATEETPLIGCPSVEDDLYDLSKMLGESLCLSSGPAMRVARLSNVYGGDYSADNFLSSVIRDAIAGHVTLQSNPSSAKDYVSIEDVVDLLPRIASSGRERIYNVASGTNTSAERILTALAKVTGCSTRVNPAAPAVIFPEISVEKIANEFDFKARSVVDAIRPLVDDFRAHRNEWESK
jgi:nucleoside-diphosphate-sugar epimerase